MARKALVVVAVCGLAGARALAQEASASGAPAASERGAPSAGSVGALYRSAELCGFPLMIRRELGEREPELLARVLLHLEADLEEIAHLIPAPALAALRRTTIWVELQGAVIEGGMSGRGMCCHWSADWLESAGLPREKAGGVEIVNARDFLDWRASQPYMTLHELAHAYHRMLGEDLPEIISAYEHARAAGLYESVGRNTAPVDETVRAYAATNHHEYFAELSEAYFALNDFEPYTRAQLERHDPEGFAMAERVWGMSEAEIAERIGAAGLVEHP
ncbi:MAG TPA: hypothetical protein VFF69_02935 [Phycisphaerales bacterium]|nr:hypothetical protein [Phycisphaerales bacterium]